MPLRRIHPHAVRFPAALLLAGFSWIAYSQSQPSPPQLTIVKVKDDLYSIEGDGGNVAVYVTSEGVILVDDKFERDYAAILEKVKSVTEQPVKYVINTHHHGDHTGGNAKMLPSAEIVATANARANMVKGNQPGLPRIVFTEETAVFLGGKEVRARYFGRGHTNGDAIVYFPALKVVHTGDLMSRTTPLIDYANGGSVVEWTRTLDEAMKQDFDTVIPGHGPVTTKAGLLGYRNNVEKLRSRAQGMIREGKSADEVGKMLAGEFGYDANTVNRILPGLMAELK